MHKQQKFWLEHHQGGGTCVSSSVTWANVKHINMGKREWGYYYQPTSLHLSEQTSLHLLLPLLWVSLIAALLASTCFAELFS